MRFPAVGLSCLLAMSVGACQPTNLYIAHDTVVGLNAAMNSEQTSGHIIIGYDRRFGAIVPKSVPVTKEGVPMATAGGSAEAGARDAMTVLSCSEMEVDGIFLTGFTEYLATGPAARKFAENVAKDGNESVALKKIFDCYIDRKPAEE